MENVDMDGVENGGEGCTVTSYLVCNSRSIHLRVLAPLFTRASRFLTTIATMNGVYRLYLFI